MEANSAAAAAGLHSVSWTSLRVYAKTAVTKLCDSKSHLILYVCVCVLSFLWLSGASRVLVCASLHSEQPHTSFYGSGAVCIFCLFTHWKSVWRCTEIGFLSLFYISHLLPIYRQFLPLNLVPFHYFPINVKTLYEVLEVCAAHSLRHQSLMEMKHSSACDRGAWCVLFGRFASTGFTWFIIYTLAKPN